MRLGLVNRRGGGPASERGRDDDGNRLFGVCPLAWFYNRYWGVRFSAQVLSLLERLVLPALPARDRTLGCKGQRRDGTWPRFRS